MPERAPHGTCLFLDVDGTLIDIASTPTDVSVTPSLVDDLREAEATFGGALALVSGRNIADLDRLFAPLRLKAGGVHGAEFRFDDGGNVWAKAALLPERLWSDLIDLLASFPHSLAENKAYSMAVHYRAAPDTGPRLRAALERFLERHDNVGLQILPGHYVYELKRRGIDKGGAITDFMSRLPFRGRRPIFIGDDITDQPGFVAAAAHGGLAYSVGQSFPGVDGTFPDPAAVRRWLSEVVSADTKATEGLSA